MNDFVDRFIADPKPRIEHFQGKQPIFEEFDLESQIHANLERKVRLKSGGSLVIDQSEALTAIDVNSGRYVGKSDLEETVYKTNLEAVKEVVNQLRFRNIGGIIIIDLIDMESADHRDKVYRALNEALRADKSKTNLLKISELGLVEMTRKRTRENLVQSLCEPCSYCEGRGYVLSPESVAFRLMREIRRDLPQFCGRRIAVAVNSKVAAELLGPQHEQLMALGEELGCEIEVHGKPGMYQEQFEVIPVGDGPPVELQLPWLEDPKAKKAEATEKAVDAALAAAAAVPDANAKTDEAPADAISAEAIAAAEAPTAEVPTPPGADAVDAAPGSEILLPSPDEVAPVTASDGGNPAESQAVEPDDATGGDAAETALAKVAAGPSDSDPVASAHEPIEVSSLDLLDGDDD